MIDRYTTRLSNPPIRSLFLKVSMMRLLDPVWMVSHQASDRSHQSIGLPLTGGFDAVAPFELYDAAHEVLLISPLDGHVTVHLTARYYQIYHGVQPQCEDREDDVHPGHPPLDLMLHHVDLQSEPTALLLEFLGELRLDAVVLGRESVHRPDRDQELYHEEQEDRCHGDEEYRCDSHRLFLAGHPVCEHTEDDKYAHYDEPDQHGQDRHGLLGPVFGPLCDGSHL